MSTVLSRETRDNFKPWGALTPEESEHIKKASIHFLKYCDTDKCIRGNEHAKRSDWHEGPCTECPFNPYNMVESEATYE